jgi:hypothetical protein
MKLNVVFIAFAMASGCLMAETKPQLFLGDDFIGYQKTGGDNSAVFIKRSEIISVVVVPADEVTHRDKPAVIVTTTGLSVHRNIDRAGSGLINTTLAPESLKYTWVFDSYAEALAAARSMVK